MEKPKMIIHMYDEDVNKAVVAAKISEVLKLTKDSKELLLFYAVQSTGFCPAYKHIENCIGLQKMAVYRAREALVEKGIISVNEKQITIYWDRLGAMCMLDEMSESKAFKRYDKKNQKYRPMKKEDLKMNNTRKKFVDSLTPEERAVREAWFKIAGVYYEDLIFVPRPPIQQYKTAKSEEYKDWIYDFSSDSLTEEELKANRELPF